MANELQGYSKFLRDTLINDADVSALVGTRVFEDLADDPEDEPYIVFGLNSARDVNAGGGDARIFTIPLYYVRAVVQDSDYSAADEVAVAIDAALVGVTGSVTIGGVTYQIRGCFRTTPIRFPELEGGTHYRHSGGLYRAYIHT